MRIPSNQQLMYAVCLSSRLAHRITDELGLVAFLLQANREACMADKDLGGEHTLECLILARRVWWQTAPLVQAENPSHPMLRMEFLHPFILNGTWDRWAHLVQNHHIELEDVRRVVSCPLYHMSSMHAPELVLAQLMQHVYVSFCPDIILPSILHQSVRLPYYKSLSARSLVIQGCHILLTLLTLCLTACLF